MAETVNSPRRRAWPILLRGVLTLLLLVVTLHALASLLPGTDTLQALGQTTLPGTGPWSFALFIAAGTLLSAVGVPRQSVALVGGYAFGTVTGTLATLGAVTLGAALAAETARRIGRPRLEARFPQLADSLGGWSSERVFARTLAVRLFPVGSNLLINVVAGLARVDRRAFLVASLIGFLPQSVAFAVAGDGVEATSPAAIAFAVVLLGLSIVAGLGFGRRSGD